MTPSGIEPAAQLLIQLQHRVPPSINLRTLILLTLSLNPDALHPNMTASRSLSVPTIRLVRLRTAVKEFQTPRSSLTARHPQRTTNGYGTEIDTGTDRKPV